MIIEIPFGFRIVRFSSSMIRSVLIIQKKNSPAFKVQSTKSGGVVVSSVTSEADQKVQDIKDAEIHRINGIPVFGLKQDHVEQLIDSCTRLEMLVSSPQCSSSASSSSIYKWIDVNNRGQLVSPPPSSYLTRIDHPSYTNRWITLTTNSRKENNEKPLGLVIRGGSEYGLGIFVSRVEHNTAAAEAGLLISDQIINVNGHDFRNISHSKAVKALRSYSTLRLLVRYIGKLPEPNSVSKSGIRFGQDKNGSLSTMKHGSITYDDGNFADSLTKGLSEASQNLLRKYRKGKICIDELMISLIPSIPPDKVYLYDNIREMIRAIDKDRYDNYVLRLEVGRLRRVAEVTASCLSLRDMSTVHRNMTAADSGIYVFGPNGHKIDNKNGNCVNQRENIYGLAPSHLQQMASCAEINKLTRFTQSPNASTIGTSTYSRSKDDKRTNPPKVCYLSNAAKQYLKFYQDPQMVTIDKCRPFLGIAIEGSGNDRRSKSASVYCPFPRVVYLHPDGASSISGKIGLGFLLVQVNGRSLEGLTHRQAARLIANLYKQSRPAWLEFIVAAPKLTMAN